MNKIEQLLTNMAEEYTPPGTAVKAVIHQWISALIYDNDLFAEKRGANKKDILRVLKEKKIASNCNELKKRIRNEINLNPVETPHFRFIDLFAGIGGMRQGFESAGGTCAFSSEFDKNAQVTYEDNYGDYPFGDIANISEKDIPAHDILIAGFPCQPFSHAGLKLGIDDTRGTLFYDIARILKEKKPKVALLENVRGLVSHDKGHTLSIILKTLTKLGYNCTIDKKIIEQGDIINFKNEAKKMVLKSTDYGVPQNRQRIYIVLWRKGLNVNFQYPEPTGKAVRVSHILEKNPEKKYTISDRLWEGHQRRKVNNKKNGKGFGYGLVLPGAEYTNTISARYYKDGSEILIYQKNKNPRKVTPREAARLQGFPEEFKINKSDVQAYRQFGNSVSVPVIKALATSIMEIIKL